MSYDGKLTKEDVDRLNGLFKSAISYANKKGFDYSSLSAFPLGVNGILLYFGDTKSIHYYQLLCQDIEKHQDTYIGDCEIARIKLENADLDQFAKLEKIVKDGIIGNVDLSYYRSTYEKIEQGKKEINIKSLKEIINKLD